MFTYSFMQWLAFFYIYCLVGWIWESSYVSVCDRKLTNRGFLYGPMLPIYGSGACIILMATLPVKTNYILIFVFGMIAATILEYITGAAMEALFKVRYWDYSDEKFNLNGHICLKCSLAWGAFSILMVKLIHRPVELIVLKIPQDILEMVVFIVSIVMAVDATLSIKEALDFKEMLSKLAQNNEEIKKLQMRMDAVITMIDNEKDEWTKRLGEYKSESRDRITAELDALKEKLYAEKTKILEKKNGRKSYFNLARRNPSFTSRHFSDVLKAIKAGNNK